MIKRFGLDEGTIGAICEVFSKYPSIEKAVLYGSRAKGNYRNGSDIDLTFTGAELTAGVIYRVDAELEELLLPYTFDLSLHREIDNPKLLDHIKRMGADFYIKPTTSIPLASDP